MTRELFVLDHPGHSVDAVWAGLQDAARRFDRPEADPATRSIRFRTGLTPMSFGSRFSATVGPGPSGGARISVTGRSVVPGLTRTPAHEGHVREVMTALRGAVEEALAAVPRPDDER